MTSDAGPARRGGDRSRRSAGDPAALTQASKNRCSADFAIVADDHADIGPATAPEREAAQRRLPRSRPGAPAASPTTSLHRALHAEPVQADLQRDHEHQIADEHQPHPVAQHPQRPEQERPERKPSRTNTKRSGSAAVSYRFGGGSCTV